eukprot:SAG22_NODE_2783_length_2214_cov_1.168322_1_plen_96_part_10
MASRELAGRRPGAGAHRCAARRKLNHGAMKVVGREHQHLLYDRTRPPALTVSAGEPVVFLTTDAVHGQCDPLPAGDPGPPDRAEDAAAVVQSPFGR